jgi:magnesium transporter
MFGKEFETYIEYINHEYNKAEQATNSVKEYVYELRQTNDSLLSTKQNEIMKTLTVINFIILPLSVITGLFGMNVDSTPLTGNPYDFWIVVLSMFIITVISTSIFKRKNWL